MAEAAGVLYAVEHVLEGGLALAKGIYDPTLPLKATITPINDVHLPRVHHSVSEVKGRAYVFGGKTDGDQVSFILNIVLDRMADKTSVGR
jgi:hypothetical protein